jgi:hypothetical protein
MTDNSEAERALDPMLEPAIADHEARYPGERPDRQPVHTMYGGAHLFKPGTPAKLGELALRQMAAYAPDAEAFAAAVGLSGGDDLIETVYRRVSDKLASEPIEDFRIDFEDGYGIRADDEEDGHARQAGAAVAEAVRDGVLPAFTGIRVKALNREFHQRMRRTVGLFLEEVAGGLGSVPAGFLVTIPKIVVPEQVEFAARLLSEMESAVGIPEGSVGIEILIETPQAVFDAAGRAALPALVDAGEGRVVAAHFGPYDYTALLSITAAHQSVTHDVCQFALRMMQTSLAGTGIWIGDGATAIIPLPVHRPSGDEGLTEAQENENRAAVQHAWRIHYDHVWGALVNGIYQSWDLHPGHLPPRFAAVYAFFLQAREDAALRLTTFLEQAARATLVAGRFDDAATGQGLLNFFLRGFNCGALSRDEVRDLTGLEVEEMRSRSFREIVDLRRS